MFRSVKLTENGDIDKYNYSWQAIGFDTKGVFSFPNGKNQKFSKNLIIFGVDMSSPVHIDNKEKDILIIGEGPTQGLDDTILT